MIAWSAPTVRVHTEPRRGLRKCALLELGRSGAQPMHTRAAFNRASACLRSAPFTAQHAKEERRGERLLARARCAAAAAEGVPGAHCPLYAVCMHSMCCMLHAACCASHDVHCSLRDVRYSFHAGRVSHAARRRWKRRGSVGKTYPPSKGRCRCSHVGGARVVPHCATRWNRLPFA